MVPATMGKINSRGPFTTAASPHAQLTAGQAELGVAGPRLVEPDGVDVCARASQERCIALAAGRLLRCVGATDLTQRLGGRSLVFNFPQLSPHSCTAWLGAREGGGTRQTTLTAAAAAASITPRATSAHRPRVGAGGALGARAARHRVCLEPVCACVAHRFRARQTRGGCRHVQRRVGAAVNLHSRCWPTDIALHCMRPRRVSAQARLACYQP